MSLLHARLLASGAFAGYRDEASDRGDDLGGGGGTGDEDNLADKGGDVDKGDDKGADKGGDVDKGDDKDKDIRIPKSEFDRRIAKEKAAREAAEERATKAEKAAAQRAEAIDVAKLQEQRDALEDELDKAMADNTPAEKKRIRAEMRAIDERITEARVEARASRATAQAVEQVRYDNAVDRMEAEYPFLVPSTEEVPNPDFNEEIVSSLLDLKAAYEATGMASSAALAKATKTLKPQLQAAKDALKKEDKAEAKGDDDKVEEAKKATEAAEAEAKRKADAVAEGLKAKKQQPPGKPGDAGKPDTKAKGLDIKAMSDKDFDKLDDDALKAARGDNG